MEERGGGGSVVEAWLEGVSMVGLPRNLKLVPDVGKPSSKTREHTHKHPSRAAHGPKDGRIQSSNRTRASADQKMSNVIAFSFVATKQNDQLPGLH